jgi:tryptophanyl-tRNA synthetase
VFDAQMVACSKLKRGMFEKLMSQQAAIREAYEELQNDPEYAKSVTLATSDKAALQGRIHMVSALLKGFL